MKTFACLIIISSLIMISGCRDDQTDPPAADNGMITGTVRLTDEFGNELGSHSGMLVSVTTGISAATVDSGTFVISNLPPKTYDLIYEKPGFGTYKRFDVTVTSASSVVTLNGPDFLGQQSTTAVSNLSASFQLNDSTFTFGCDINPVPDATHPRAFRIFFAKTTTVNFGQYTYTPTNTWVATAASGVITAFSSQILLSNGFSSGDSVFAIAYGESIRTNTYTDPVSEIKYFPNLNTAAPSNIAGFKIP